MKRSILVSLISLAAVGLLQAQTSAPAAPAPTAAPGPQPPIYPANTAAPPSNPPAYIYDQKPMAGRSYLIAPEQAQSIINRFKDEYKKLGNPRFLIYVNRELIDENSGLKLSSHKQVIETARGLPDLPAGATNQSALPSDAARHTERVVSTNIYRVQERKPAALADRQTVRDIERLFGRPLRMAGVQLADQGVASQLVGSKALDSFGVQPDSEQARRDREALNRIADVVLEILVSSKDATVPELSGDRSYATPDIQATAIRLSDARILGQATAADLIGQGASAGMAVRNFGIREIAEATALSLMEDIMLQ